MFRSLPIASGSVLACLSALPVMAAETATTGTSLDEVVIVATRTPVSAAKIGNSVTVINEQAIEQSQAAVLSDLLVTTPGITFSRNGGPGTTTQVRIRGAETDQTLVLIDGVQMNDPAAPGGGFDFGNLLVGDVSRIEILRGSQSTVYGSQAIGGVVNIITRDAPDTLGGDLQAEAGGLKSSQFKTGVGSRIGKASFRIAGGYYRTAGVSGFAAGTETDPFRNTTLSGRFGYDFTPDVKLDLRTFYTDGKYHYDGFPAPAFVFADEGDYGTTRQFVGYAGLNFNLFAGRMRNRIAYQSTDTRRLTYLTTGTSTTRNGRFDGKNSRVEYQGNWTIADGYEVTVGLQNEKEKSESDSAPLRADVGEKSVYAQLQAEVVKGLTLTAGDRQDDHDTFGTHNTAQAAAAWALPSNTVLRTSWAQGFKAPTLYQLYSPYSNLGLEPEESAGWDAGVQQRFLDRRVMVSGTYFSRDTRNQIDFSNCSASLCAGSGHSPFGVYTNTARTRATGVELQAVFNVLDQLDLSANYTHMEAENRVVGSTTFGKRLARRPDDTGNVSLTYRIPVPLSTTVAARYAGESFDNASNSTRLAGYVLIDVRASYALSEQTEVYGRLENVADRSYQTVYQYGTVGRTGYLGLRLKF